MKRERWKYSIAVAENAPSFYLVTRPSTNPKRFNGEEVARVDIDREEDARLIAALPELLDALQEAERVIRWAAQEAAGRVKSEITGGWIHHAETCREAIAKATETARAHQ